MHIISSHTDHELLVLMAAGRESAFTEIYNRYWDKLFVTAVNKLHNLAEAEEMVQEIFLDLWNRRDKLAVTGSLEAYLAVAVKYKVINVLAKRQQQQRYAVHAAHTLTTADHSTEHRLSFDDLQSRLATLVKALPDKCRLVFELSRVQELSHKEIATEMGIAEKTVEAHLAKAIRTIRAALGLLALAALWLGLPFEH